MGTSKKSQPLLPRSTFQRIILDNTKFGLHKLYSLCSWQHFLSCSCTDRVVHFHLHKLRSLFLEFTQVARVPALPAAQTHTSPADTWSWTHNSSQHLSCFPEPESKSSDHKRRSMQTQSTLKIKFCNQASFAEGNFSLATSEYIISRKFFYKNASVAQVHPTASALLPWKCFS